MTEYHADGWLLDRVCGIDLQLPPGEVLIAFCRGEQPLLLPMPPGRYRVSLHQDIELPQLWLIVPAGHAEMFCRMSRERAAAVLAGAIAHKAAVRTPCLPDINRPWGSA